MPLSAMMQHLVAGTAGGLVATVSLYPLELLKTRMQVAGEQHKIYRSLTQSCKTILQNEGIKGFYQGVTPAVFAASGSWGGYFLAYEMSKERKLAKKPLGEKLGSTDHLLSGVEAGVILVLIFNPIWVVKTRLALQGVQLNQKHTYSGPIDALSSIARLEGIRGLYKGLVPALLLTSHGAIQFTVYEYLKQWGETMRSEHEQQQPAVISASIGGVSKIFASVATYPYQVVKSKLQQTDILHAETNTYRAKYSSTLDCVAQIWRRERVVGFFRGVVPNSLKVAPSSAVTFLVYEETLKYLRKTETET